MKRITIEPVSRIEGHAKISIQLDDQGKVAGTEFHVTQVRGFEKFTEGHPFYEMPGITARICGICPISHLLASSKACDAIMAVRIPPAAKKLRELIHFAQIVQSHALSFFYLSAPDFLLGMDSDPASRNVLGVIAGHPELARDGIELRKFGLMIVEGLAQERVHPSWIVPGGVASPLSNATRDRILAELPAAKAIAERTIHFFKEALDNFKEEIEFFGSSPTMYAGMVDRKGNLQLYDGDLRFRANSGEIVEDHISAEDYSQLDRRGQPSRILPESPLLQARRIPRGCVSRGPLGTAEHGRSMRHAGRRCRIQGIPSALRRVAHSAFLYHYARLIEIIFALERIEALLADPQILDTHVRATAGVNSLEGVGMIEAPRGTLIHHYKVNEEGRHHLGESDRGDGPQQPCDRP